MEKTIKRIGTPVPNNIQIFWEGTGWYYYMNNWKYSSEQQGEIETDLRRYFDSEEKARRIFCNFIDERKTNISKKPELRSSIVQSGFTINNSRQSPSKRKFRR